MKFVDAHIHLSDPNYGSKAAYVIEEAKQSNVVALVSNSMNYETCIRNIQLAEENKDFIYVALGIHPWNVTDLTEEEFQQTRDFILQHGAKHEKVVAIGEVGLDPQYAKRREIKDKQVRIFKEMLAVAEKLALPVIVHSRWTAQKIMPMLTSYSLQGVLFHWFTSPLELLPQIIERGYYVSEGPPTVFSNRTQEVISRVPITSLLTETDGPVPYYGPFEGKMTTPAFIPKVVEAIAKIKSLEIDEAAEHIRRNFSNFFQIENRCREAF